MAWGGDEERRSEEDLEEELDEAVRRPSIRFECMNSH